jgi:hypothetical protein
MKGDHLAHWAVRAISGANMLLTVWFWKMAPIVLWPDTPRLTRAIGAFVFTWLSVCTFVLPVFLVVKLAREAPRTEARIGKPFAVDFAFLIAAYLLWTIQPYTFAPM